MSGREKKSIYIFMNVYSIIKSKRIKQTEITEKDKWKNTEER